VCLAEVGYTRDLVSFAHAAEAREAPQVLALGLARPANAEAMKLPEESSVLMTLRQAETP
jgi:hypothetical protein